MNEIILGPPGTGKTTFLINEVKQSIADGSSPQEIAYMAFTRKAADEAVTRSMESFALRADQLPYFRTFHSLAFRALGLKKDHVLNPSALREFGKIMGIKISGYASSEDGLFNTLSRGDRALFMASLARIRCVELKEQWEEDDDGLEWAEVEWIASGLKKFKDTRGLIDFTDMLYMYLDRIDPVHLSLLVVDEAQDLSKLQWQVQEKMARRADRVIIAGDDDQAIFRWAGADVEHFINLQGTVTVLDQSYRVPTAPQAAALQAIVGVKHRRAKEWSPRPAVGSLQYHVAPDSIDMSTGEWLVLVRNSFLLEPIEEKCRREGLLYTIRQKPSVNMKTINTIRQWEHMRKGGSVSPMQARDVMKMVANTRRSPQIPPKWAEVNISQLREMWGVQTKEIWHDAFINMAMEERLYYLAALRRGEDLAKPPRITLSTIHSAKGGQSDNVILFSDMAKRTYDNMEKYPEDECRVFYVGLTRVKENLHIILPDTNYCFHL